MFNYVKSLWTNESQAMFLWLLVLPLILVPTAGETSVPTHRAVAGRQSSARVVEGYGKLPLAFEANQGQTDTQVKFLSHGAGYSLFLTSNEAVLTLSKGSQEEPSSPAAKSPAVKKEPAQREKPSVLRMKLLGASTRTEVIGQDQLPGKSNYFLGKDPKKWHTNVAQYAKVRYANVYSGVDLVYYGNQRELEYDFVVQPGADPTVIRLGIEGAQTLRLEQSDLVLTSAAGEVHLRRPHIYQETKGARHYINGGYVLKNNNEAGFRISAHDPTRALIIDPVLAYSSYLGGNRTDDASSIAVDSAGNAYVAGDTSSTDFPTADAIQPTIHSYSDAFVTKVNSDGTALVYSTYLGGSAADSAGGIAVDSAGNAYVTGMTSSPDFPTANAIQPTIRGFINAFVTKINAQGSALVFSTYLGGSGEDSASSIAVDSVGSAYVSGTTSSNDFPTVNAIQPTNHGGDASYWCPNCDAFVTKFNAAGTALVYSTYLGGTGHDTGNSIAIDSAGNAYVTGNTDSTDFPRVNAIQSTNHGGDYGDAFVSKINAQGSALVYSTYLGGSSEDWVNGIAVDTSGNALVGGWTLSSDFPTANAIRPTLGGPSDAFVAKFNADGTILVYSTYLGGTGGDSSNGITVDSAGNAYVTGNTGSADFPTVNAIQPTNHGNWDGFMTKINVAGSALVYSTYLGGGSFDRATGVAVDLAGTAYIVGWTRSTNFPKTLLAFQKSYKGGFTRNTGDAFVAKVASQTFVDVSPLKLGFPTQVIGTLSTPKKLTVANNGSDVVTIRQIYIAGINSGDFAERNNCPTALSAGGTCSIWLTFEPSAKKARKGLLGISDSDPATPQAIPLSGTGTVVSLSFTRLAFGKQLVGSTSVPQSVTLTNIGSTPLNFTGISITGTNAADYSQTNTCGTSIAAGANCTITVRFTPSAIGSRAAAVSIGDDGGGSPQRITLNGRGT